VSDASRKDERSRDMRLENMVPFITGGASGIGRSVAQRFQTEGTRVVIADRDAELLERTRDELGERAPAPEWDNVVDVCLKGVCLSLKHEVQAVRRERFAEAFSFP
jgi:NAD(P)-dependent dehydrogenase (short-subunit alcohol dehydrogenase family)